MLIEYEDYEANTKLKLNIGRCIILRLFSLAIALLAIYGNVGCENTQGCFNEKTRKWNNEAWNNENYNEKCPVDDESLYKSCTNVGILNLEIKDCDRPICWETYVGQQFYILTLLDLAVQV